MMSACRKRKSGARMCSMLARDPVSTLSTQMTRCPRLSSSSQRWEPRNPAPPVTRQVAMAAQDSGDELSTGASSSTKPLAPTWDRGWKKNNFWVRASVALALDWKSVEQRGPHDVKERVGEARDNARR